MIITGTGSSEGTWTLKRTSIDHYRDRILDRDMDSEKDESWSLQGQDPRQEYGLEKGRVMIITRTGSSTGTWTLKTTSIDHYKNQDKKLRSRQGQSHVERSGEHRDCMNLARCRQGAGTRVGNGILREKGTFKATVGSRMGHKFKYLWTSLEKRRVNEWSAVDHNEV
jgi:hypothetical protein